MTDPATSPARHRLVARLLGVIYALVAAVIPTVEAIENNPTRSWQARTSLANRFWAVLRDLLALTPRIQATTLSAKPVFPPSRPRPAGCNAPRGEQAQPKCPARPTHQVLKPLTPRQLAKRLAVLLHQLNCLLAEAAASLPARARHLAARARAIAGCDALPPKPPRHHTWERAG